MFWTPAFAGVTTIETFYEIITPDLLVTFFRFPMEVARGHWQEGRQRLMNVLI